MKKKNNSSFGVKGVVSDPAEGRLSVMGSERSTSTLDGRQTFSVITVIFFYIYIYIVVIIFLPDDCAHDATFIPSSASGASSPLLC